MHFFTCPPLSGISDGSCPRPSTLIAAKYACLRGIMMLCAVALLSGCGLFSKKDQTVDDVSLSMQGPPIPYTSTIEIKGLEGEAAQNLKTDMEKASQLIQLAGEAPDSLLGLERRARVDQETALKLLHSQGYYDGKTTFGVEDNTQPVAVSLILAPGQRYTVGEATVEYKPSPVIPPAFKNRTRETGALFRRLVSIPEPFFPTSLRAVKSGSPALADTMLDAVERLPALLQRQGYPFAKVSHTRYTLDRQSQQLNALITVDPGPPALMGNVNVSGNEQVQADYIQRLRPWRYEEPWNERLMEQYAEALQQLGLFRSVQVQPAGRPDEYATLPVAEKTEEKAEEKAENNAPLLLDVNVNVAESAFRTAGASARYSTDKGFGVQGTWEHRNLLGHGELLRLKGLLAQDDQTLSANFEKPAFGRTNQKLLASAQAGRIKTDAYTTTGAKGYIGLERKLTSIWWAELGAFADLGSLLENNIRQSYRFGGIRFQLKRDTRINPINPRRGTRFVGTISPFAGHYGSPFSAVGLTLEASAYYPVFSGLILAGRVAAGGMLGASKHDIPATLRYYAGGGGSVRGYPYQGVGPRNADDKPEGGRSFQEINLEARIRLTKDMALVPFVDGGMVQQDTLPKLGTKLDWAVGLGLRYTTPIGPVRLDVAFPLTHKGHDKRYQLYISIGQAF